jgi:hypothetical protein
LSPFAQTQHPIFWQLLEVKRAHAFCRLLVSLPKVLQKLVEFIDAVLLSNPSTFLLTTLYTKYALISNAINMQQL